ncbi:MAG: hypothetical protein K0Q53_2011 [Massilibacillus sp.]|jgi:CxxC-x17-CxxC domain-containing protein|nr:hypothetical protein [Massilibacillus sp.]
MTYQDKELSCKECGVQFAFTASEQDFYAEKGFQNEPSRCPECRAARKAQNNRGGNNNSGFRQQREMFDTVCSECGKETQVPFKPTAGKPVFCRDCFQAHKAY